MRPLNLRIVTARVGGGTLFVVSLALMLLSNDVNKAGSVYLALLLAIGFMLTLIVGGALLFVTDLRRARKKARRWFAASPFIVLLAFCLFCGIISVGVLSGTIDPAVLGINRSAPPSNLIVFFAAATFGSTLGCIASLNMTMWWLRGRGIVTS